MQPIVIEIDSAKVTTRTGEKNGRSWAIHQQIGYLKTERNPRGEALAIDLLTPEAAYPVGKYVLDAAESVYVGKYGQLAFSRQLKLINTQQGQQK